MITTSFFELFKIGPGPSSSHTVGPMRAAKLFKNAVQSFIQNDKQEAQYTIKVALFGSLADTGKGHGTHRAVVAGLYGEAPQTVNIERLNTCFDDPDRIFELPFEGFTIDFVEADIFFNFGQNPYWHPNAMKFILLQNQHSILEEVYFSVGGGFIQKEGEGTSEKVTKMVKYPYQNMKELVAIWEEKKLPIEQIILENEMTLNAWTEAQVFDEIGKIMAVMKDSVARGLVVEGVLPGGLNVHRRAKEMYAKATEHFDNQRFGNALFARMNAYALATSEENAAGHLVVTAPTNGAAGIIPAALMYLEMDCKIDDLTLKKGLLLAAMVGFIIKDNASISGAALGCQAEVGSAASMAAALFSFCLGEDLYHIISAAEIAMEHHLGMTCDPIKGLVQVPCIERNANGTVKAYNAYLLASGRMSEPIISFDQVVEVMRQTGEDLSDKYKETARGGLAISFGMGS